MIRLLSQRTNMTKLIKPLVIVAVCLTLFGGCYLQQGGWMMVNPKFDEKRLLGLTRSEVLQRLGPPSFDPQAASTRPWNETEDAQDYLGYYQSWATCAISFKNGKVDSVRRFWK